MFIRFMFVLCLCLLCIHESFAALKYNLTVPPKDIELFLPELREGGPVTITCIATQGRPPPKLQMFLDDRNITGVSQGDVYDENSKTYTSVVPISSSNRTWNDMNLTCTCLAKEPYGQYVTWKSMSTIVKYKYPPSRLEIVPPPNPLNISAWYQLNFGCQLGDCNTECKISWTFNIDIMQMIKSSNSDVASTVSVVHFNVSDNSLGHHITCQAVCEEFDVTLKVEYEVDLPIRSNPLSNISLGRRRDQNHLTACVNTTECSMHMSMSDAESSSEYECIASNIYGKANQTIQINDDSEGGDAQDSTDNSIPLMSILIGLGTFVLIISSGVVVVFIRGLQRRKRMNPQSIPSVRFGRNIAQQDDPPVPRSDHDETVEANINQYSNILASTSRVVTQGADQKELVYADIDIAFLEMKQKKVKKTNRYVPTEYTRVRELTADVSYEHVYVNT